MARLTFIAALAMYVIVASFADRDERRPVPGSHGRLARKAKRFVINGEDAIPHEFPWTVYLSILNINRTLGSCTGSLISPRVVLTASHCIKQNQEIQEKDIFDVLLVGIYPGWHKNPLKDLVQRESNPIEVAPIYSYKFISPPLPKGYASYSGNDYGVVILSKPLKSGKMVQFIPFADSKSPNPRSLTCYSAGFGHNAHINKTLVKQLKNESDNEGLKRYKLRILPDVLQKERYRIQSPKRCDKLEKEAIMKFYGNVTESKVDRFLLRRRRQRLNGSVICGLSTGATSGNYYGDSGGPLMCRSSSGPWVLYGVNSEFVKGTISLSFFANVPIISQWLEKVVAKYDPEYASGFNMGSSNASMSLGNRTHAVKAVIKVSGKAKWSYNMKLSVKSKRNVNTNL